MSLMNCKAEFWFQQVFLGISYSDLYVNVYSICHYSDRLNRHSRNAGGSQ